MIHMMRLAFFAAAFFVAGTAAAFDPEDMNAAQRAALHAEIRAYLLENPEVILDVFAVLENRQIAAEAETARQAVTENADLLFRSQFDWVGGNPDGDVTLVEFFDYACGFCRRAHPEITELIETDGNIRFVLKEFPILGEDSMLASRFAIATRVALGDAAYAAIHDGLMGLRGGINQSALVRLATDLGLDADIILATMDDPIVTATIDTNHNLAQRLGISGTPSFIFNDQFVRGYLPLDDMMELVLDLRAATTIQ